MTVWIRDHNARGFLDILCDDAGRNHPIVIRAIAAHHRIDIGRQVDLPVPDVIRAGIDRHGVPRSVGYSHSPTPARGAQGGDSIMAV